MYYHDFERELNQTQIESHDKVPRAVKLRFLEKLRIEKRGQEVYLVTPPEALAELPEKMRGAFPEE